jgi:hypothetical protein
VGSRKDCPEHLRRIRFKYPEAGEALIFLADDFALLPLVAIVKKRPDLDVSLYTLLQIFSLTLFGTNAQRASLYGK